MILVYFYILCFKSIFLLFFLWQFSQSGDILLGGKTHFSEIMFPYFNTEAANTSFDSWVWFPALQGCPVSVQIQQQAYEGYIP